MYHKTQLLTSGTYKYPVAIHCTGFLTTCIGFIHLDIERLNCKTKPAQAAYSARAVAGGAGRVIGPQPITYIMYEILRILKVSKLVSRLARFIGRLSMRQTGPAKKRSKVL